VGWMNGDYYIFVPCGAGLIRKSMAQHDRLRYGLGWISAALRKSGVHTQGSEWSAEDWTGLASPVGGQVQSNGGN